MIREEQSILDHVRAVLKYVGDNPDREGLKETPDRIIRSWEKLYGGYKQEPAKVLGKTFSEVATYDEMILLKNIEFYSTCEHHMLPFFGEVFVAYIPGKRVVGISKLARLVEVFARRLQIQERMTAEIADTIMRELKPKGAAVLVSAQHFCMVSRGVEKQKSKMVTSALRGVFSKPAVRGEFLRLCGDVK